MTRERKRERERERERASPVVFKVELRDHVHPLGFRHMAALARKHMAHAVCMCSQ